MGHKSPAAKLAYSRAYRAAHPDQINAYARAYHKRNRDKILAGMHERYMLNRETYKAKAKAYRRQIKLEAMQAYGGAVCACCRETHIEFLCIDHINGGGMAQRRKIGAYVGNNFYKWLKAHNYPLGFRVVCVNCNFALGHAGYCPHQIKPTDTTS